MSGQPDWFEGIAPPVVDLHLHTTASDGLLSPTELIARVAETSLRIVAITDHDSTAGIDEALAAAVQHPHLTVIPGIELSANTERSEVHLLGLLIDYRDSGLQAALKRFRNARVEATRRSVVKLNQLGIKISWERVRELADGTIGRPHVARAMVEAGYIKTPQQAFDKYLGDDGLARVDRERLSARDGISLVRAAGGVTALAHPRTVHCLEVELAELAAAGLDGIELFAEKYPADVRARYAVLARQHGLVPCGGSDYHAFGTEDELEPGAEDIPGPPLSVPEELRRRAEAVRDGRLVQPSGT